MGSVPGEIFVLKVHINKLFRTGFQASGPRFHLAMTTQPFLPTQSEDPYVLVGQLEWLSSVSFGWMNGKAHLPKQDQS